MGEPWSTYLEVSQNIGATRLHPQKGGEGMPDCAMQPKQHDAADAPKCIQEVLAGFANWKGKASIFMGFSHLETIHLGYPR